MPACSARPLRLLCLPPLFALCLAACDRSATGTPAMGGLAGKKLELSPRMDRLVTGKPLNS